MTKKLLKISKYKTSILQGKFEFSAGSERVSLSLEHPRERMILQVFGIALAVLIFAYLYFVTASVLNVMARREALAQINDIQSRVGSLEQRYFALAQSAGPEDASALGLSPVEKTEYVYRPGNAGTVTIARNAN